VNGIRLGKHADTASRFVGIGNTFPVTFAANSGFSGLEFGGPTSAAEGFLAFHTHDLGSTSGERMRIDKSGNVGIGMTPAAPLDISRPSGGHTLNLNNTSGEGGIAGTALFRNGTMIGQLAYMGTSNGFGFAGGGDLLIGGYQGTDLRFDASTSGTEAMRMIIKADTGNVGIGTTTPGERLTVVGSGSTSASTALNVFNSSLGNLFSVRNDGNVGIGANAPAAKLHIKAGVDNNIAAGLRLEHATDSDYWSIFPENSNNRLIFMFGNQYPGGNYALLSPTASGFITVSDARTKKNIEVIRGSLAKVMLLAPKTYRFKSAEAGTPLNYGFMAQEVERVYPDLVTESHGMKALATNSLIAINTQAIQELKTEKDAELKALKSEIFELKAQLAKIQAKDKARDAKLAAIEKLLLTADNPMAQPVSLKKSASGAE
jgi:Chaperone of endosialidase